MYMLNSDEYIMYVLMILKTARLIEENKHHFLMIEIIIIIKIEKNPTQTFRPCWIFLFSFFVTLNRLFIGFF